MLANVRTSEHNLGQTFGAHISQQIFDDTPAISQPRTYLKDVWWISPLNFGDTPRNLQPRPCLSVGSHISKPRGHDTHAISQTRTWLNVVWLIFSPTVGDTPRKVQPRPCLIDGSHISQPIVDNTHAIWILYDQYLYQQMMIPHNHFNQEHGWMLFYR